jgi:hypothetical protein
MRYWAAAAICAASSAWKIRIMPQPAPRLFCRSRTVAARRPAPHPALRA